MGTENDSHLFGRRSKDRTKGLSAYAEFLEGLLRDPTGVSAPTPSSPALASAMASKVDPARAGLVIELGAGTGVVTSALLDRGIDARRLVAIELGEYFVNLLRQRFPSVKVVQGDAMNFGAYLPLRAPIAAIVSGLPLLNFSKARRHELIAGALRALGPGGRFIQLSYGWRPPITSAFGKKPEKMIVWRNLPPAHIWTYQI